MIIQSSVTMASCAAISIAASNISFSQGLIFVYFWLVTIIFIIIIFTIIALFASWLQRRKGVTELTPRNFMDLGDDGDGDDRWTKFVKKIKRLFGKG